MTRRVVLITASAVALVLALVAAVVLLGGGDDAPRRRPPASFTQRERAAFVLAETACTHIDELRRIAQQNGSADDALDRVRRAEKAAKAAADADVRWVPLAGAVTALRVALRDDDGHAANVGIRTARASCTTVGGDQP